MRNKLNMNKMNIINHKTMRKIAFALLMFLTLSLNAQNDGIIKFVGIPVDGSKSEMISKLKQKGFTYDYEYDLFKGKFDGEFITGKIETYNDKVYNIRFMHDVHGFNKSVVINKFNSFVLRYDINEKYISNIKFDKTMNGVDDYKIDVYEDIGYEMKKVRSIELSIIINMIKIYLIQQDYINIKLKQLESILI